MGSLGAFFSTDFDEISITIGHRLRASGRRTCLLVIVFVNAKTKIFRDHIGPYIGDWHYRSADSVEFVFPGFQGLGEPKDHGFRPQLFEDAYQDQIFVRATKAFEERSAWRWTGDASIVICNASIADTSDEYSVAHLELTSCVEFDLEAAMRKVPPLIPSAPVFFQSLIAFAKDSPTASVEDFSGTVGIRNVANALKDGLVKSVLKWLKIDEEALQSLEVAKCFAVRNIDAQ